MATTPNYGWVMPDPTDFVTDLPADFEIFGDAVDTTLEAIETKLDVITTEGDLVVGDASGDPVRLPIGAVGTVLTSDGDTAEWATASSGGMSVIASGSLGSSGVNITSIPATFKDLRLELRAFSTNNDNGQIGMRFNNDSTTVYSMADGTSSQSFRNQTGFTHNTGIFSIEADTTAFNYVKFDVFNYTSTTHTKYINLQFWVDDYNNAGMTKYRRMWGGYNVNNAVDEINVFMISQTLDAGTYILYGVS
jgi:hypothetical protein